MRNLIITFFAFAIMGQDLFAQVSRKDSTIYQEGIQCAMYPTQDKIFDDLISITSDNKDLIWKTVNGADYVLMLVWMRAEYIKYYEPFEGWGFYNTGKFPMWVTAAPELLTRIKEEKSKDVEGRLKQMLGLSPTSKYDYFIELWVKPEDLIRPCPDNEITDAVCDLCFPADVDSTYQQWFNTNRVSSYYKCGLFNQVPWTQLGYTYDWNPGNKHHIGLSEFIIPAQKNVVVKKIYTNDEYLNQ